jgi:NADH-quinone oxidoreductase subunit G
VAGIDLVQRYGVGKGTNLKDLGRGDVILVVAGDVEESAPIYSLRLMAAAKRGATLIVANSRETKMDRYTKHSLRYKVGTEAQLVYGLLNAVNQGSVISDQAKALTPANAASITGVAEDAINQAGKAIADAKNLVVVFGDEQPYPVMQHGEQTNEGRALAQACANLVVATGHVGKADNGLLPLWPHNNTQGVYDMLAATGASWSNADNLKALYIVGTDPIGGGEELPKSEFVIVQELFMTETAKQADVILPAVSFAERDGTFTNAERRVQRYYKALPPLGGGHPDWDIIQAVANRSGVKWGFFTSETVMDEIASTVPAYNGMTYPALAVTKEEWPPVGGDDLYFGGTAYDNRGGVGLQLPALVELDGRSELNWIEPGTRSDGLIIPRKLNRHGTLIDQSKVYEPRLIEHVVEYQA